MRRVFVGKVFAIPAEEVEREKCGGCGWRTNTFYVIAENEEEAKKLAKEGHAGLCGECLADLLANYGYEIVKNET